MANDLNLPTIADGQADGQWQTSNDADSALANAVQDTYTVDFSGGNVTLTSAQFRSAMTFIPSGLSTGRDLTVPAVKRAQFIVHNTDSADTITVKRGATSFAVGAGQIAVLYTDGTTDGLYGVVVAAGSALTAASTTDVLTGTNTSKYATADAVAALWEKGADVASATTTSLGEGGFFHVTGTTTITDIDWATAKDGRAAYVVFDGVLTLTHNATTLKLPGAANITTAAGDRAIFVQDNSDNVICIGYFRADGSPLAGAVSTARQIISGAGLTGGGDLSADRTLAVGAGTGITVNADDVALNVSGLTEDTSPDESADFLLTYDTSAATHKKVKPDNVRLRESFIIAVGDETTAITTGTAKVTFRMPYAFTVTDVRASLNTVSSSGTPTVDINEAGATILSTKLTIDASEFTSTTAATPAVISDAALADDAEMTIDIDTAGTGAKGLKVVIIGVRA